jgi:hypothetical protein
MELETRFDTLDRTSMEGSESLDDVRATGEKNIGRFIFTYDYRLVFLTYQTGFFTYHGFQTIMTSSRIISRSA